MKDTPTHFATPWSGDYWLPTKIWEWLLEQVGVKDWQVLRLIVHACRYHGGPENLGRPFMAMRNQLAKDAELGLSANQIQRALTRIEKIGLYRREPQDQEWRPATWPYFQDRRGWRKRIRVPTLYKFAEPLAEMLRFMHLPKEQKTVQAKVVRLALGVWRRLTQSTGVASYIHRPPPKPISRIYATDSNDSLLHLPLLETVSLHLTDRSATLTPQGRVLTEGVAMVERRAAREALREALGDLFDQIPDAPARNSL